jgi:hypothetical protein
MTRCKREIVGLRNERDFPASAAKALRRNGRSRHEVKQFYIQFCFPDAATADAFRNRFGGECLTYAPAAQERME